MEEEKAKEIHDLVALGISGISISQRDWPDVWSVEVRIELRAGCVLYSIWVADLRHKHPRLVRTEELFTLVACETSIRQKLQAIVGAPTSLTIDNRARHLVEKVAQANRLFEDAYQVLRQGNV